MKKPTSAIGKWVRVTEEASARRSRRHPPRAGAAIGVAVSASRDHGPGGYEGIGAPSSEAPRSSDPPRSARGTGRSPSGNSAIEPDRRTRYPARARTAPQQRSVMFERTILEG